MIELNEIKKAQFIQDFRAAEVLGREQEFLKANGIDWDIEKSMGEGSKGGKVIGHTKSGHPIYDSHLEQAKHHSQKAELYSSTEYNKQKRQKHLDKFDELTTGWPKEIIDRVHKM